MKEVSYVGCMCRKSATAVGCSSVRRRYAALTIPQAVKDMGPGSSASTNNVTRVEVSEWVWIPRVVRKQKIERQRDPVHNEKLKLSFL